MVDIPKSGGAISKVSGGASGGLQAIVDPDYWLTTTWRALNAYIRRNLGTAVYEIVMGYPEADDLLKMVPIRKTIIAVDIDDISNPIFGLGDTVVDAVYDEVAGSIEEHEAQEHIVMFSINVWASVESGGVTSRLQVYELLCRLFHGVSANRKCLEETDGIDILEFSGGTWLPDTVGDTIVYRIVDITMRARIYSRVRRLPVGFIETITVEEELSIDQITIT